ncbi:uncharacterized protein DEA37_0010153 [Paragonimus westermani]|uniref:Protein kinase domain-containing protein n=1 Tax=Paragonimus westermani TaxID=34504 RepID=A0A5J4NGG1_9TREM|nr:uncharacterized protein DEA37_0010153 [Paragonimus westermani]
MTCWSKLSLIHLSNPKRYMEKFNSCASVSSYFDDKKQLESVQHLIEVYKSHSRPSGSKLSRPFTVEMLSEIDIDELELTRDDVEVITKLGEGEFGEVFKAVWRGELLVAVKKPRQKMDFLGLRREANALHKLRHKHIVQLLGICTQPRAEPFLIILEYMANGDLLGWLKKESRRLSIRKHISILAQVSKYESFSLQ